MIQFLRGTKSSLTSDSTVFKAGQPVFESDTGQLKIGNGSDIFSALPYVGQSSGLNHYFESDNWSPKGYIDLAAGLRISFEDFKFPKVSPSLGSDNFTYIEEYYIESRYYSSSSTGDYLSITSSYTCKAEELTYTKPRILHVVPVGCTSSSIYTLSATPAIASGSGSSYPNAVTVTMLADSSQLKFTYDVHVMVISCDP